VLRALIKQSAAQ